MLWDHNIRMLWFCVTVIIPFFLFICTVKSTLNDHRKESRKWTALASALADCRLYLLYSSAVYTIHQFNPLIHKTVDDYP